MADSISRLVSGTATISIPPEWLEYREVYLSTAIVREPSNKYINLNYSPPRSRYGTINVLAAGLYVRETYSIDFELQYWTLFTLQPSQNLLALICALEAILDSIVNLANAIPDALPISKNNPIVAFTHLSPNVDRVVIRCYADTAVYVSLIPAEMDRCDPSDGVPSPPPPPPPPPPKVLPGTPLDGSNGNPTLDPPQDGEPPELNEPFPLDTDEPVPDTPFGEVCERWLLIAEMTTNDGNVERREDEFYGIIEEFYFNPSSVSQDGRESILVRSRGLAVFEGAVQPCGSPITQVFLQKRTEEYSSHSIISATKVEV